MKTKRGFIVLGIAFFLASFGLAASGLFGKLPFHPLERDPQIEYSNRIDLGDYELGEVAIAKLKIANKGGKELRISNVRTNCSCTGLEREVNGHFARLNSLSISPGSSEEVSVRISVRPGIVNAKYENQIYFETNDPKRKGCELVISIRQVHGGLVCVPNKLSIGSVPISSRVSHTIEVFDPSDKPRVIKQIVCSNKNVKVRFIPNNAASSIRDSTYGMPIGKLQIDVLTDYAGEIDTLIQVVLEGRETKVDQIHVFGRVVSPFEFTPSLLSLPRYTSEGLNFTGTSLCRSTENQPFSLSLVSAPAGVKVKVIGKAPSVFLSVAVECEQDFVNSSKDGDKHIIQLKAISANKETLIELPIIVRR